MEPYKALGTMTAKSGETPLYTDTNGAKWRLVLDPTTGKITAVSDDYDQTVTFDLALNDGDASLKKIDDYAASHKPKGASKYVPYLVIGGLLTVILFAGTSKR
jgi:hypothetical protein